MEDEVLLAHGRSKRLQEVSMRVMPIDLASYKVFIQTWIPSNLNQADGLKTRAQPCPHRRGTALLRALYFIRFPGLGPTVFGRGAGEAPTRRRSLSPVSPRLGLLAPRFWSLAACLGDLCCWLARSFANDFWRMTHLIWRTGSLLEINELLHHRSFWSSSFKRG